MAIKLKTARRISHMRTRILISVFIGIALLIGLGGCGGAVKQISAKSQSMSNGCVH